MDSHSLSPTAGCSRILVLNWLVSLTYYVGKELADIQVWLKSPLEVGQVTQSHFRNPQPTNILVFLVVVLQLQFVRGSKYHWLLSHLVLLGLKIDCPLPVCCRVGSRGALEKNSFSLYGSKIFYLAQIRARFGTLFDWSEIPRVYRKPVWWDLPIALPLMVPISARVCWPQC